MIKMKSVELKRSHIHQFFVACKHSADVADRQTEIKMRNEIATAKCI